MTAAHTIAAHGGPSPDDAHRAPVRADFSTSVNAYGPAPSVRDAIARALTPVAIAAYPDPSSSAACAAVADVLGVDRSNVVVGAGATELILAITLACVAPGDVVLVPPFAFAEYERAARLCRATVVPVGLPCGAALDAPPGALAGAVAAAVAARAPRLVWLCTPESPRGRAWPREAIERVERACARAGSVLVVDQSFDAFTAAPLGTPALRDSPRTLSLRSLTKDHALAGLRVGHLVGAASLVAAVERARMPWATSALAQTAAIATCDPAAAEHVRATTARLRAAAAEIHAAATALGVTSVPSDTHYLLLDVGDAASFARAVRERHALKVRDCTSFGLPSHVRVAARTPDENRLLVAAIQDTHRGPP